MAELTPPTVYQAHPVTGEYVGTSLADPDPLDKGNWLIPGRAFLEAPPEASAGFAAVHVVGEDKCWTLLPDLRGDVYRTDTGLRENWTAFGELPEGLTAEPCPGPYHVWADGGWRLDASAESEAQKLVALDARDGLLRIAATRMAPLTDAVELGEATPEEEAELKAWKRYRVDLNRIQLQSGFPSVIDWPAVPGVKSNQPEKP